MRHLLRLIPVLALLPAAPALATSVATLPSGVTVGVSIDGASPVNPVPVELNDDGTGFELIPESWTWTTGDGQVTINQLEGLFDPVLVNAVSVIDTGAPSSFTFTISSPLIPVISGSAQSTLTIGGSATDGTSPADGSSISPFATSLVGQATVNGIGVVDAGPAAVFAADPVNRTSTYGAFTVTTAYDCTAVTGGDCTSFDLSISFTGSGNGDAFAFTASHEIVSVPEPAGVALLGLAAAVAAGRARRRA